MIISSELILIATITGLGMLIGLSKIACNVTQELEDVGAVFGSINQTFSDRGTQG